MKKKLDQFLQHQMNPDNWGLGVQDKKGGWKRIEIKPDPKWMKPFREKFNKKNPNLPPKAVPKSQIGGMIPRFGLGGLFGMSAGSGGRSAMGKVASYGGFGLAPMMGSEKGRNRLGSWAPYLAGGIGGGAMMNSMRPQEMMMGFGGSKLAGYDERMLGGMIPGFAPGGGVPPAAPSPGAGDFSGQLKGGAKKPPGGGVTVTELKKLGFNTQDINDIKNMPHKSADRCKRSMQNKRTTLRCKKRCKRESQNHSVFYSKN